MANSNKNVEECDWDTKPADESKQRNNIFDLEIVERQWLFSNNG